MKLFEIVTTLVGESYVRSYAWAESVEDAERMFRDSDDFAPGFTIVECLSGDEPPFITALSDDGSALHRRGMCSADEARAINAGAE